MRSTFSGFNSSVSGLFAAQRALDIIGHNVANENTEGYTRQRSLQSTLSPTMVENGQWLGLGVKLDNIRQIRDEFLDIKYRTENAKSGYWDERNISLRQVEDIFGEPRENGISTMMANFFTAMDEVIKDSDNPTVRANFVQTGITFTNYLNETIKRFEKMIRDVDDEIKATVVDINDKADQIAALNQSIAQAEFNGGMANDLRDKRNMLIDDLSNLADIKIRKPVHVDKDGHKMEVLQIELDGNIIVNHGNAIHLKTETLEPHPLYKANNTDYQNKYYEIDENGKVVKTDLYTDDLKDAPVTKVSLPAKEVDMNTVGGKLGAMLQQRDSYGDPKMGCEVKGIPYYVRVINEFTRAMALEMNRIHHEGMDSDGNKGGDLFVPSGTSNVISARNISINTDIINSPKKLAVGLTSAESDARNFQRLLEVRNSNLDVKIEMNKEKAKDLAFLEPEQRELSLAKGIPEDILKSMISSVLGVEAKEAKTNSELQKVQTTEVNMQRMSVSGVSENEELTNMIKYQHAYNASARMITTIDEMIDVIVNRMGRVGL